MEGEKQEKIIHREIEEEMKTSYLDYSMSVIVGRALPDVRDGLKPVHRRILYAMYDMGMFHNKPFKKSARIVGECLGKYHPHGDMAVYDALVRMVQDFSLRYPLIQGQGNFGSIDGDNAAAMRYTEARLKKVAEDMLEDIDKKTVKFVPNFDGSLKEPAVLPSKIPNLLVNGSSGIAVGMATNIPPHNIIEVCDGIIKTIDNPEISSEELMDTIKGPDFPTGAVICGKAGITEAYKTGRGRAIVRAKTRIEGDDKKKKIIVTEIPYQVNKSEMLEQIAELIREKKITGVEDLRDESDREGMRIVIELKTGAISDVVLNQLFKHTRMQSTFGINMVALVDNEPKTLSLKGIIQHYIKHRQVVVRKRTEFDLKNAKDRAHILEGIIVALDNIDNVIQKIKASKDVAVATSVIVKDYSLTETQAKAILDMKLQRLASLERERIKNEHKELLELIERLKSVLADEKEILNIIKKELADIKEKYGDERKTEIGEGLQARIDIEDLIKKEDMIITVTHFGYIKRLPINTYKQQKRGGHGVIAAGTKEEDFVEDLFVANTHSYLLFFTDKGKVHWLKVYEIPVASRMAKGSAIVNLLRLDKDEKITAFVPVKEFKQGYLFMATKKGMVKKTPVEEFSNPRRGGIIAINLETDDNLINVELTDGKRQIILATKNGLAVRFKEEDVRPIGRAGKGVIGIRLKDNDHVVGMVLGEDEKSLLSITENGYGKRSKIAEYRLIGRGGSGVINIQCTDRNGKVVAVKSVTEKDEVMLISQKGIAIRMKVKGISQFGRNTQGVRLMKLDTGDIVVAAAKIIREDNNNNVKEECSSSVKHEGTGNNTQGN
jgi:DNA gyrase subunit A